jgi:predicted cupin superfamily sugar epimerase
MKEEIKGRGVSDPESLPFEENERVIDGLLCALGMTPHPEGGFYSQTYISDGVISSASLGGKFEGDRHYSTAIYYLLREGEKSRFHRLLQDEVWHFYRGDPLRFVMILPGGEFSDVLLSSDFEGGGAPQRVVRAGTWFGAVSLGGARGYSLAGCTVAPGFDYRDFELASADEMRKLFPDRNLDEIITEFCFDIPPR